MKNRIITILGKNGTTPAVLDNHEHKAVYTFKNDVFCLKEGWDIPFDELEKTEQENIVTEIESGNYKLDNTFQ